jgi:radical SAM protein with 4Fe4S-binding SPASM domain
MVPDGEEIDMDQSLTFVPLTAVWEITFACNMRCKHCGSKCDFEQPDELTTDEALDLAAQMGDLGMTYVTLSGGEPFVRPDWDRIAAKLRDSKVVPNVISNGWFIDESLVQRARDAGVSNIAVSIDGLEENHDRLRMRGSFQRILRALDVMKRMGMPSSVVTSLMKDNLPQLPAMHDLLVEHGVMSWQVQIAMPMGHFARHRDRVVDPEQVPGIIDFAHDVMKADRIAIDLADCLGYFSTKDAEVRARRTDPGNPLAGLWAGCPAGMYSFGIRCNGDITGCNSIRDTPDRYYFEGNVRDKRLRDIWTRPGAFAWNREATKAGLTGFCGICAYGSLCRGGCTSMKQILHGSLDRNDYCVYRQAVADRERELQGIPDPEVLSAQADEEIANQEFQSAQLVLDRLLQLRPDDVASLDRLGFVHYQMDNYPCCRDANLRSLALAPDNAYAMKGLGVCLARMGELDAGLASLRRAVATAPGFLDAWHDLAVTLAGAGRADEARGVLDAAIAVRPEHAEGLAEIKRKIMAP